MSKDGSFVYFCYLCPMKLSVIIPVYDTAATLERCVMSVAEQGVDETEIIIVNDGSTNPQCETLCRRLATNVPHMIYVAQRHAGLSAARNHGLELASGDFIAFVDSDDYLEPSTYKEVMSPLLRDPTIDMVEFSYIEKEGHDRLARLNRLTSRTYDSFAAFWLENRAYRHAYMWNKVFRRHVFETVRFPLNQNFEDVAVLPALLKLCRKTMTTSQGLYHYTWNGAGITAKATTEDVAHLLDSQIAVLNEISNRDFYKCCLNIQLDLFELGDEVLKLPVLPYHGTLKLSILHLFGLERLCRLNRFYRKMVKASR